MLNDFEAVGYGVSVVPEEDTVVLNDAAIVPGVRRSTRLTPSAASNAWPLRHDLVHGCGRPLARENVSIYFAGTQGSIGARYRPWGSHHGIRAQLRRL